MSIQPLRQWNADSNVIALPSGHSVEVQIDGGETIAVRSPGGDVQVSITLTDAGPVVNVSGGKLQLEAQEDVAVRCRTFSVHTEEDTKLHADGRLDLSCKGEMKLVSAADMIALAEMIHLN